MATKRTDISTDELLDFIHNSGDIYASGDASKIIQNEDGSSLINALRGDFSYNDIFYGGEPYGGRELVFYKNKPLWMMLYYGWVEPGQDRDEVYKFLQAALKAAPKEMPYRGPSEFKQGEWKYETSLDGNVERLRGEEVIYKDGKEIYRAWYMGGLVDLEG